MSVIILSGNHAQTQRFAKQEGLLPARHVVNADQLRGLRPSVIHYLPSYYERRDVHAIESQLRHIRRGARYSHLDERRWEYDRENASWVEPTDAPDVEVAQPEAPPAAPSGEDTGASDDLDDFFDDLEGDDR